MRAVEEQSQDGSEWGMESLTLNQRQEATVYGQGYAPKGRMPINFRSRSEEGVGGLRNKPPLFKIMEDFTLPGLLPDPRSDIDKQKDYVHEELAPQAVALNWNRDMSGAPTYSVRSQDGSGSCVAQAGAKALEIITGVVQSAHPPYRRRANFPTAGMWLQNYGDLLKHLGTTSEVLDKSQDMTEAQMNSDIFVDTPLTEMMYISADFKDMDVIAMAIETQKHCMLTVHGNLAEEYAPFEKPIVVENSIVNFGHCICATYYFTDENGEKCILVEESWGKQNITKRILTETYIKARCTGAMYLFPVPPTPPLEKPHFNFLTDLKFGQSSLGVKMLQEVLRYENLFSVQPTGYYGQITATAVLRWQIKHNVAPLSELNPLQGGSFGPKSRVVANSIYNV